MADDHKILLDGLHLLLSQEDNIQVDKICSSGEELIEYLKQHEVDMVFLDINMPGQDGIDTLRLIKELHPTIKCIMLSFYSDLSLVDQAMKLGANGYITKSGAAEEAIKALHAVQKGESYYGDHIREKILSNFGHSKTEDNTEAERAMIRMLTARELDVLKLIVREYTSDEIAKALYIAKSTVDTHRKNLIRKLQVKNSVGLALFAERNGLS